ncbi:unnamed protein product [Acanthoscelides obtectus]|uniref:SWIM-type domain-containing protein n=1 Tax=Acanthoscelides obtectus TaxID=200917 RepID=A0A9P0LN62_ACAOB|nr:unnamed protein product [Acanthoscelides obtectus]CAK1632250.1 hypothetical protein AOBTE_LOCUS7438 [Acanthoscelides obtectus]
MINGRWEASKRKNKYYIDKDKINGLVCTQIEENIYNVQSKENNYIVNTEIESCTCYMGNRGGSCKHQLAVVTQFALNSQQFHPTLINSDFKELLHKVVYGVNCEIEGWYLNLNDTKANEVVKINNNSSAIEVPSCRSPDLHNIDINLNDISPISTIEKDKIRGQLEHFVDLLMNRFENNFDEFNQPILKFLKNVESCKTNSSLTSALCTFVAYNRAATMEVSVNSFRTTGLFPLNRNIFRDHDFSVFEVEEKLTVPEDTVSRPPPGSSTESRNIEYTSGKSEGISCIKTALDNPRPGTSKDSSDIEDAADDPRPGNSKESNDQGAVNSSRKAVKYLSEPTKLVSPVQIKHLPKIKSKKPSARAGSAALITSSPYKDDLTESLDKKRKKEDSAKHSKVTSVTKKVKFDDAREAKFRKPKSTKRFKKKRADLSDSSTDESDDLGEVVVDDESDGDENYDAECLFCTSMYSADKHGEQWVRCTVCYRWAHEDCGAEDPIFVCPMCEKRQKK